MPMTKENSITVGPGGTSERVVLAAATANKSTLTASADGEYWVVTVDALTFVRKGTDAYLTGSPAVVNVDQVLLANQSFRIGPLAKNDKLGFISTPGGNVYITPSA